jgi:hypothetical protein
MDRHLALHCFCRVVETGGFAAAARDLGHSPSMVSKTIQDLEAWTGSRLLARTTRRMQLTEAGERFYAYSMTPRAHSVQFVPSRASSPADWCSRCRSLSRCRS